MTSIRPLYAPCIWLQYSWNVTSSPACMRACACVRACARA
jgi:hypothetical protein